MADLTIWKYRLAFTDKQAISVPEGQRLEALSAQIQGNTLCLWALVDPNGKATAFDVFIFGTGNPINAPTDIHFIDTVQDGPLVWHIFWRRAP